MEEADSISTVVGVGFRRIVWPFAIAETLIWASTFYVFPALLLTWETELGWSKAELSGAFTLSLIITAVVAPMVGRMIDFGRARQLFFWGSLLAAGSLALMSFVQAVWQFYVLWFLIGIAMAAILYEACFAVITKAMGSSRKRAITWVTLAAGFASTISFPANRLLVGWIGWRWTMVVLAVVILTIVLPLFWMATRAAERYGLPHHAPPKFNLELTSELSGNLIFWLLGLSFALMAFNHNAILTHLLPLLDEKQLAPETAVFAASLIGPMQVAGRLLMVWGERRVSAIGIFYLSCGAMALASISLFLTGFLGGFVFLFVMFQGAGHGIMSILRPVITGDLMGMKNFGLIAGFLALASQGAAAAAPTAAALLWGFGGYDVVILTAIIAVVMALVVMKRAEIRTRAKR